MNALSLCSCKNECHVMILSIHEEKAAKHIRAIVYFTASHYEFFTKAVFNPRGTCTDVLCASMFQKQMEIFHQLWKGFSYVHF